MTKKELISRNIQLNLELEQLGRENRSLQKENARLREENEKYQFQLRQKLLS